MERPNPAAAAPMPGVGPSLPYPVKAGLTRARSAGVARQDPRGRVDERGLRILLYHRVADDGDPLALAPARFREQMDFLAGAGYRAIDLEAALALLDTGELPDRGRRAHVRRRLRRCARRGVAGHSPRTASAPRSS